MQVHEDEQTKANWEHGDDGSTPPSQASLELIAGLLGYDTFAAKFVA